MTQNKSAKPQTAVLLHAFPLDARMWDAQKAALEEAGLRVTVPHLPGFGGEDGELSSLKDMAEALVDRVLPQEEPVSLVGLSMGGYLALEVLATLQERGQTERVARLVLADTHAGGDDAEKQKDREKQAQKVLKEGQEFMVETAREEQKPSTAEQTARMTREATREGVAAALRAMAARADRRGVLRRAGEQGVQVLALVGSEDELTPPEQAQENADLSGGQLKVIEGAGHLSNLDEPEAFNQALVEFFELMTGASVLAELRREFLAWQAMNTQAERLHLTETRMQNAWTWRELLAHLTAWQEVTLARLRAAPDGAGLTYPAWASSQNPDGQDLNAVNARIQAAARGQSWPQSHAAWERGFAEVLERAQALSNDDLTCPRDWLDGYTLLDVLHGTLTHHRQEHRPGAQRWLDSQAGRAPSH